LEVEQGFGHSRLQLDGNSEDCEAHVINLGPMLRCKRRVIAIKLALPSGGAQISNVNQPLLDATCLLHQPTKGCYLAGSCTLRPLHVPSLLIEGLTGVPIRVHLAEDIANFDAARKQRLTKALGGFFDLPHSSVEVDRVQEGSVLVDARLAVQPEFGRQLLESFDQVSVEQFVRSKGFDVVSITIPGQCTARRLMQLASAETLSEEIAKFEVVGNIAAKRFLPAVEELAQGYCGSLDPWSTRQALVDAEWARTSDECLHKLIQLRDSHWHAFASCPSLHSSVSAYDSSGFRAGMRALVGSSNCASRPSAVSGLKLLETGFEELKVEFEGVGCDWQDKRVMHRVFAIQVASGGRGHPVVCQDVVGSEGVVRSTVCGLHPGTAYRVRVATSIMSEACAAATLKRGGRSSPTPVPKSEADIDDDEEQLSTPVFMRTRSPEVAWEDIAVSLGEKRGFAALNVRWDGFRRGPHWLVKMLPEELPCLASEPDEQQGLQLRVTQEPSCQFEGVPTRGVRRFDVQAAPAGRADVPSSGRCWFALDPDVAELAYAELKAKYDTGNSMVERFSKQMFVQTGT